MVLKRCFAVFVTACLIFSVSLAPCSAAAIDAEHILGPDVVNADGPYNGLANPSAGSWVTGYLILSHKTGSAASKLAYMPTGKMVYFTPIIGSKFAYGTSSGGASTETWKCYPSFGFVPSSGAINTNSTMYVSIGMVSSEGGTDVVNYNKGWKFGFYDNDTNYVSNGSVTLGSSREYVVTSGNPVNSSGNTWLSQAGQIGLRIDITASEDAPIRQVDFWSTSAHWTLPHTGGTMTSWGYYIPYCFVMETSPYQSIFDDIFNELVSIDNRLANSLPQIYSTLQSVVTNLEALNTDTDTIIEILNQIKTIETDQLGILNYILTTNQSIDTTVKQIYALMLSEVDGSDDLSSDASSATGSINNNDVQEVHWQTSMSYNFDQLQLGNYNLNLLGSGLALVGNMFSSIWSAFGQWSIVFTFPLILGIALLVIGRLSRTGGGNSSRNSEHKGGEGGA